MKSRKAEEVFERQSEDRDWSQIIEGLTCGQLEPTEEFKVDEFPDLTAVWRID